MIFFLKIFLLLISILGGFPLLSAEYYLIREDTLLEEINFNLRPRKNLLYSYDLKYTITSNQLEPDQSYHFYYDDQLQIRKITKLRGKETLLNIEFDRNNLLQFIEESVRGKMYIKVEFNQDTQINKRTIQIDNNQWEYVYSYEKQLLKKVEIFYNKILINWQILEHVNLEKKEKQLLRVFFYSPHGNLMKYYLINREASVLYGNGIEKIEIFNLQGIKKKERIRIWENELITDEYLIGKLFQNHIQYLYNENQLIKEKLIFDKNEKLISRHNFFYKPINDFQHLVFNNEFKQTSLEKIYLELDNKLFIEKEKFFDFKKKLISYTTEENFKDNQFVKKEQINLGFNLLTKTTKNTLEQEMVDGINGKFLSKKKTIYDRYHRVSKIKINHFSQSYNQIKYFYDDSKFKRNKLHLKNDFYIKPDVIDLGKLYYANIYKKYLTSQKENLKTIEEKFKNFTYPNTASFTLEEKALLSRLKLLQATQLKKVVFYNQKNEIVHYYRIRFSRLEKNIQTASFYYYPLAPELKYKTSIISAFKDKKDFYNNESNNNYYKKDNYGGIDDFNELALDNIDPNDEKLKEKITIFFTDEFIIPRAIKETFDTFGNKISEINILGNQISEKKFN